MGKKQIGNTDEQIESLVASLVQAGDKLSWTYDDQNGTLTVDTSALDDEEVQDQVAGLVTTGTGLSATYDDQNGELTVEVPEGAISGTELNFDPATSGDVDAVDSALADHEADGTNPHNVSDDQTGAATALSEHESSSGGVHGVAGDDAVAGESDVDAVDTALSDHEADTTNPHNVSDDQTGAADALSSHESSIGAVHGVAAGDSVASQTDVDRVASDLTDHESATGDIHGVAAGDSVAGQSDVDAVDSALSDHETDTTNPHNVSDDQTGAADARTDLRFALFPEEVDPDDRKNYYQNFEKFANSAAMTSIAASAVVMDEVAASRTAMDAVSASATAMEVVSTSQVVMNAVAASIDARSSVLESDYAVDLLWASTPGGRTILESGGSPTLPYKYETDYGRSSAIYFEIEDGSDISLPGDAASALELRVDASDPSDDDLGTRRGLTVPLDLSNSATLEFQQRADNTSSSDQRWGVDIDGSIIWSTGGSNSWTNRSVDVSSYGGTHDVMFYHKQDGSSYGDDYSGYFTDINLL